VPEFAEMVNAVFTANKSSPLALAFTLTTPLA
jgi:hypothetical protein